MKKTVFMIICLLCLNLPGFLNAQSDTEKEPPSLFYNIGPNILNSFWGYNALFMAGGVGATALLVNTDTDAKVNDFAATDIDGIPGIVHGGSAALFGAVMPVIVPAYLYFSADDGDYETLGAAAATGQSVMVSFSLSSLMKAIAGRVPPTREDERGDTEARSREFHTGFMNEGIFDGWPSGHSMVNMSMAATLANYYPEETWIQVTSYGYALYIISGVVFGLNGQIHWMSDGVAGGLMGYAIGSTIGKSFYRYRMSINDSDSGSSNSLSNIMVFPLISTEGAGIAFSCSFQ